MKKYTAKELLLNLRQLEEVGKTAEICGGTVSSANLQACLVLLKMTRDLDNKVRINKLAQKWRQRLKVHNGAQPDESWAVKYCLITGKAIT